MKIEELKIIVDGYVYCKSTNYMATCTLNERMDLFVKGTNVRFEEIDYGTWGLSYLLSMYRYKPNDFILSKSPDLKVNKKLIGIDDIVDYSCYMDKSYPLFSNRISVDKIIEQKLVERESELTKDDIRELFCIDKQRFIRPISGLCHEQFKAMAAIAYTYGKQIYCFPWMSKSLFDSFHMHLTWLIEMLSNIGMIVIIPIGR